MILDSTLRLEAVLAGAGTPPCHVDFVVWNNANDITKPAPKRTALTGATPLTILDAPTTQGFIVEPLRVIVANTTGGAITATVQTYDGTTRMVEMTKALAAAESLCWEKNVGWYII